MRAKFINEISQNTKSGLGSIGVGSEHITRAAIRLENRFPGIVSDKNLEDELKKYLLTVKNNLDIMLEQISVVKSYLGNLKDYALLNIPEDTEYAEKTRYVDGNYLNPDENQYKTIVYNDYYDKNIWKGSYLCYVNLKDGVGCLGLTDMIPPKNNFSTFFVRK
jgi:coenzyme F420-reducing hydrogenase alpha subunit